MEVYLKKYRICQLEKAMELGELCFCGLRWLSQLLSLEIVWHWSFFQEIYSPGSVESVWTCGLKQPCGSPQEIVYFIPPSLTSNSSP